MDRIIEVKVCGNHLSKDSNDAGVRGEANVTQLRITFDEGWYDYTKKITFWDARGLNPVTIVLLPELAETENTYLVPIPAEPMTEAGMLTFVVQGTVDDKVQRSLSDKLKVKDAPIPEADNTPVPPTEDELTQLEGEIEQIKSDILLVRNAKEDTQKSAESASKSATNASRDASIAEDAMLKAQEAVGKTSYIGANGNWYAWDSNTMAFYDTGVKAQSGSTVYVGENPPDEADVWIEPNGEIVTVEEIRRELTEVREIADNALAEASSAYMGVKYTLNQHADDIQAVQADLTVVRADISEARSFADVALSGVHLAMNGLDAQLEMHNKDIEGLQTRLNEESHFRGYLSTNAKIQALVATPNDFVYSAESGTKWVYDANDGWQNTGVAVPDQLTPASDVTPLMNGTASVGTEQAYARGDHRHPIDTTRASVAEVNEIRNMIGDIATLLGGI